MRRTLRIALFAAVCGAAIVVGPVGVAWAAPPPNNTFAGATVIPSLPFNTTEDTTQAKFLPATAAAISACIGVPYKPPPYFSNAVWFKYTATTNQAVQVDPSASFGSAPGDYYPAIFVVTGTPSSFSCQKEGAPGSPAVFTALKGTTYHINVAAQSPYPPGGTLRLSVTQLFPMILPTFNSGTFSKNGSATLTGTGGCAPGTFVNIVGGLTQSVGRLTTISGGWDATIGPCDGAVHPWSSTVITPSSGMFRGGKATATFSMTQCLLNPNVPNPCAFYPNLPPGPVFPRPVLTQTIQLNKS